MKKLILIFVLAVVATAFTNVTFANDTWQHYKVPKTEHSQYVSVDQSNFETELNCQTTVKADRKTVDIYSPTVAAQSILKLHKTATKNINLIEWLIDPGSYNSNKYTINYSKILTDAITPISITYIENRWYYVNHKSIFKLLHYEAPAQRIFCWPNFDRQC